MTDTRQPDNAAHVTRGGCPFIDSSKTFCNGEAGHEGAHWALREDAPGKFRKVTLGRPWSK